jgi:hypothetical protein
MKINYKYFEDILTYARISEIKIDNDFEKTLKGNNGVDTKIKGRILLTVKLYTNEEGYTIYNHHKHIIENVPIEGINFVMCDQEIHSIEKVLEALLNSFFENKSKIKG